MFGHNSCFEKVEEKKYKCWKKNSKIEKELKKTI